MATVRKTITVTDQQDAWIKAQIDGGHYTNDSEYIRDLIRKEQERNADAGLIRQALIDGENSGGARQLNAAAVKQRTQRSHG